MDEIRTTLDGWNCIDNGINQLVQTFFHPQYHVACVLHMCTYTSMSASMRHIWLLEIYSCNVFGSGCETCIFHRCIVCGRSGTLCVTQDFFFGVRLEAVPSFNAEASHLENSLRIWSEVSLSIDTWSSLCQDNFFGCPSTQSTDAGGPNEAGSWDLGGTSRWFFMGLSYSAP